MKRIIAQCSKVVVLVIAAVVGIAGPVWADSPHFIGTPKATLQSDGDLNLKFKEAGLGTGATNYVVNATVDVSCVCVNNGGQCPDANNKSKGSTPVGASFQFFPQHGNVSQTITVAAPGCPASLHPTCGGGQHFELVDLTWHINGIADCTNGVPNGATCSDTNGDLVNDTSTAYVSSSPTTLSASGLFVCP